MPRYSSCGDSARHRTAAVATLCASLLLVTLTSPAPSVASTDDHHALTHQKAQLNHDLATSRGNLDEVSQSLVTAQGRLDGAVADLGVARSQRDELQVEVQAAAVRDEQMQKALDTALERLANARDDLVQGQATVARQRSELAAFAVSNATSQVTQLSTLGLVVTAGSTHEAIGEVQGSNSAIDRQLADVQRLQANQVLLRYTEQRVRQAAAAVAADRAAAAANLVQKQTLEAAAIAAASLVELQVSDLQTRRTRLVSAKAAELRRIQTMQRERTAVEARLRKIAEQRAAVRRAALAAAAADAAAARKAEAARSAASRSPGTATAAGAAAPDTGVLAWPVVNTYVTSPYGMRMHPILHIWELHDGTDFHAVCGTPVYAAAAGRVTSEYFNTGYGNRLFIDHGFVNGVSLWTSYNHLTSYVASPGEQVSRGQLVAYSGTTGYSTGCHLHFMVYVNGTAVDPMTWL